MDHLYCKDPTFLEDIAFINPVVGDHVVISSKVRSNVVVEEKTNRRDWRHYSKEALNTEMESMIINTEIFVLIAFFS